VDKVSENPKVDKFTEDPKRNKDSEDPDDLGTSKWILKEKWRETKKCQEIKALIPTVVEKVCQSKDKLIRSCRASNVLPKEKDPDDEGRWRKSLPRKVQKLTVHRGEDRGMSLSDEDRKMKIVSDDEDSETDPRRL